MTDGTLSDIGPGSVRAQATGQWPSPHTVATYPSGWQLDLPDRQLVLALAPQIEEQELYFPGAAYAGPAYWEGAVDVYVNGALSPTRVGYVELTGYAHATASTQ